MNNRRFIEQEEKLNRLGPIFGNDWHKKKKKTQQNSNKILNSIREAHEKIVDFLMLDINDSELNVAAELMNDRLHWFNEHFDETCNIQLAWSVCDEELREQIVKSIENVLLPAYGNFFEKFQEFLGKHVYEYIKYGMFEIQDRLNNLFLVRKQMSLMPEEKESLHKLA
ncbi:hypothetical protein JHK85_041388 [Glycine max]|uniref:Exocyst subunit Exo70 family protein n=1 Tax=Glycine max TaxID=3847 RepID=K7M846_SOYBN|nr:hypothetical protein JHK86_040786 [Glycine max]KAG4966413.1 hypothetical protein JHK85_041388 [Glycine max]KAH1095393.1 hypothetical protein GYH30_040611 [Glycine max]